MDRAADWTDTWMHVIGAVHHMAWARADAMGWTEFMGPRWSGYDSKRYAMIMAIRMDPTAWDAREYLRRLHNTADKPTMAGG